MAASCLPSIEYLHEYIYNIVHTTKEIYRIVVLEALFHCKCKARLYAKGRMIVYMEPVVCQTLQLLQLHHQFHFIMQE